MLAGFSRSRLDDGLMRLMDVILAFPQIVLVLLFVSMLGSNLALIVGLVALSWVPQVARVARGVTADIVHREYVAGGRGDRPAAPADPRCARSCRTSRRRCMVEYGLRLTWSIAVIAAISFLGFGIQPPNADWGLMINENRDGITLQPWAVVAPALCIARVRDRHELHHRGRLASRRGRRRRGRRVSAARAWRACASS